MTMDRDRANLPNYLYYKRKYEAEKLRGDELQKQLECATTRKNVYLKKLVVAETQLFILRQTPTATPSPSPPSRDLIATAARRIHGAHNLPFKEVEETIIHELSTNFNIHMELTASNSSRLVVEETMVESECSKSLKSVVGTENEMEIEAKEQEGASKRVLRKNRKKAQQETKCGQSQWEVIEID